MDLRGRLDATSALQLPTERMLQSLVREQVGGAAVTAGKR
jgi:hypothetical protein